MNYALMHFTGLLFVLLISSSAVLGQSNRCGFLTTYSEFDTLRVEELHLRFENQNFFRNNELRSGAVQGYTLVGFWVRPLLEYYPLRNIKLRAGAHIVRHHGIDFIDRENSLPYFSIQYNPLENFEIILGNFDEFHTISMPEMLLSPELYLSYKPAGGLQLKYHNHFLKTQFWINWETYIKEGDPFQEELTQGLSVEFFLLKNDFFRLTMPVHVTYHHRGGEINSNKPPIETLLNGSAGFHGDYSIDKWGVGFEGHYIGYKEATSNHLQAYAAGNGALARVFLRSRMLLFSAGYWVAESYLAPKGDLIYQSFISTIENKEGRKKQLLEGRGVLNRPLKYGLNFGLEVGAFYDILTSEFSYSYGIHLAFTESFFLWKKKHHKN